jgi:hypothetical protein
MVAQMSSQGHKVAAGTFNARCPPANGPGADVHHQAGRAPVAKLIPIEEAMLRLFGS